jgi:hypothetical protein
MGCPSFCNSGITKPHIKIPNNLISVIKFKEKKQMSNKDLFKEAIADAKAVREAALANAKVALEEALAPKLQSMLAAKLQEMESEDAKDLEEVDYSSDSHSTDDIWHTRAHAASQADAIGEAEDAELEEDFDLSEILAELSDEKELDEAKEEDEMNEAKDEEKMDEAKEESEEEEAEDEESEEESEEEEAEGDKITDLTVDELKDIIKDIISAELEADETMAADDMEVGSEEEMSMDMGGEEGGEEEIAIDEEIDLEELLAELDSLEEADDDKDDMYEAKEDKEEMEEALATIQTLRNELNEVNLLNAKLLYVNKVFKAKNLTESQKLKVIAQFDKATTAQEAKTIFESMNNAIAKSAKSTIKESLGFASKAAGVAPQKQIVQVDETVSRWQMLAGIK